MFGSNLMRGGARLLGMHLHHSCGSASRFEVGWAPTFAGVVLVDVLVNLVFERWFLLFLCLFACMFASVGC